MIREADIFNIGHVTKTRGLNGEVEVRFTDDIFDRGEADYLVLIMDGIPVPYFWEEYRFKNDTTAIFKFADLDNETAARHLVGRNVCYPQSAVPESEAGVLSSHKALTGFRVSDENGRFLGIIDEVDDSSANILLRLSTANGSELYLPFHDDFLIAFDLRERTLQMYIPEGLLSLNP
ncbi:MAG: 16S rRNA processing protein RimM [Prevotellaceae bacterium]|nr:16S rRNA processing protein RimM [Prevotellaceae bacterium]